MCCGNLKPIVGASDTGTSCVKNAGGLRLGWPWSLLLLIAEESLIRVAECIIRMFILGLGNDPAYDLSGHFRRNEEWSTPCIRAKSWVHRGRGH